MARTAESIIYSLLDDIKSGESPPSWPSGDPAFDHIEVAPGRIVVIAAPPGVGKTTYVGQMTAGMLQTNPELRVAVANVEMSAESLLNRQLSRISGVELAKIRSRKLEPSDIKRLEEAADVIGSIGDRITFVDNPHGLKSIIREVSDFTPDVLVIDYAQRIGPTAKVDGTREKMNALMAELRKLADQGGIGIIAISATGRTKDNKGRTSYSGDGLTMASLRESSELEYGADDVLIMVPQEEDPNDPGDGTVKNILLKHEKCRHGESKDVNLVFHRRTQRFELDPWSATSFTVSASPAAVPMGTPSEKYGEKMDRLRAMWGGGNNEQR